MQGLLNKFLEISLVPQTGITFNSNVATANACHTASGKLMEIGDVI